MRGIGGAGLDKRGVQPRGRTRRPPPSPNLRGGRALRWRASAAGPVAPGTAGHGREGEGRGNTGGGAWLRPPRVSSWRSQLFGPLRWTAVRHTAFGLQASAARRACLLAMRVCMPWPVCACACVCAAPARHATHHAAHVAQQLCGLAARGRHPQQRVDVGRQAGRGAEQVLGHLAGDEGSHGPREEA
jgi:hypothetical protein